MTVTNPDSAVSWDPDHAAGIMNLIALYESGQAKSYWIFRAAHSGPAPHKAAA